MHSSGMRTTRLLTVSQHALWLGGAPARGMYLPRGGCTCLGGVPARGGVYLSIGCTSPGGVPAQGGVSVRGGVPARGGYLPGGVPAQGGVPDWGCTCLGGVPAKGCTCQGGTCPGTPLPWTEWLTGVKHNLSKLRLQPVITTNS